MIQLAPMLLPSLAQVLSLAGLLLVVFGFAAIGAVLGGRERLPEADPLVGWAVVAGLFAVAGGLFHVSLSLLAAVTLILALGSGIVLWRRGAAPLERGLLKVVLWMGPLLLATASMQPSQWDEFSQWLPNARYLFLFDAFPGPGHPVSDSVFPSYPPSITIVFFLVGRLIGSFSDTVAPWLNLLLLACGGRLMVRLFRDDDAVPMGGAVWGVLGITVLATTFVPKLVLTAYADTATAVSLGFSAVLGLRLWQERPDGLRGRILQFGLVFAILPMTKQGNFALMGLLVLVLAWEALRQGPWRRNGVILAAALVPAAVMALAWRLHVTGTGGDMSVRGLTAWEWGLLPEMLLSMKDVIQSKGGYFGLALVLTLLGLSGRMIGARQRLVPLFAVVFLGYNAFLVVVYLAILAGYESAKAASFWRYNTHLGVLEMFAAAVMAGVVWRHFAPKQRLGRVLTAIAVVAAVTAPFAAHHYIRFDLQQNRLIARATIAEIAPMLPPHARLMVVDARGTGFFSNYLNYYLGFGRHVVAGISAFNPDGARQQIQTLHPDFIWVRTLLPPVAAELGIPLDERASHLLAVEGGELRLLKSWPYPADLDPASDKD